MKYERPAEKELDSLSLKKSLGERTTNIIILSTPNSDKKKKVRKDGADSKRQTPKEVVPREIPNFDTLPVRDEVKRDLQKTLGVDPKRFVHMVSALSMPAENKIDTIRDHIRDLSIPASDRIRILRLIPTLGNTMDEADVLCQEILSVMPTCKAGVATGARSFGGAGVRTRAIQHRWM